MSSTPSSAPVPRATQGWEPWQDAAQEWLRSSLPYWLFIAKTLAAALLSLWIAMRLELPQPRTAMTTVFIVMQPYSGAVIAKSFYRIAGTVIGSLVSLLVVGLFAHEPTILLAATIIWIGICTAGATRNRNFRSYAFVLAGYTAALVAVPTIANPDSIFQAAVTRVNEVSLGVIVSTVISALVFPQFAGDALPRAVRSRFTGFVEFVAGTLAGRIDRAGIEATNVRIVGDVISLEATRSVAVFEHPETRLRSPILMRMNHDFMAVSTRLHALHQLFNRLRDGQEPGSNLVREYFEPYLREIAPLLSPEAAPVLKPADAGASVKRLVSFRASLPQRLRATREQLTAAGLAANQTTGLLLDFDTAAELLLRFVDELYAYTDSYAALAKPTASQTQQAARPYVPKTGLLSSAISGLRAVVVLSTVGLFWFGTAWPGGELMMILAGTAVALAATTANPVRVATGLLLGAVLALPAGAICVFLLYPLIDGFPLLCVVLTPFLVGALALTTHPRWGGVGTGFLIFFCFSAGPDNVIHYDPIGFFNNMLGIIFANGIATAAFALILPPNSGWWLAHILRDLRGQVVMACSSDRAGLPERLEGGTRDLMQQASMLTTERLHAPEVALSWMFLVLEVGHAVLELRDEIASMGIVTPIRANTGEGGGWQQALRATRLDIEQLFRKPTVEQRMNTLRTTSHAIAVMQATIERVSAGVAPFNEAHIASMHRIASYLHFIRSALLDPVSPLPGGASFCATAPTGVPNVA